MGANGSGGSDSPTPSIDALAREGLSYSWCRTVAPLTLPAHASMLTGLVPPRHGIRDNGLDALAPEATTLAELARRAGLRTAAFVSAVVLDQRFGLQQGFEVYDAPARQEASTTHRYTERAGHEAVERALAWVRGLEAGERFFLWIHLFEPHAPYTPPAAYRRRTASDYLGEVAVADAAVGLLLQELRRTGQLEETFCLLVADHGEDLGDHGEPSHASFCYDTTMRVPLILRYPDGYRSGERAEDIASVVDVFPTLLEALGVEDSIGSDGLSLYRRSLPPERGVYFETYYNFLHYGWSHIAGWANAQGKLVHSAAPEFYRPGEDPLERRNLVSEVDLDPYRRALERIASLPVLAPTSISTAENLAADLRQLGYAGTPGDTSELPGPADPSARPAPRDRLGELRDFLAATELSDQGRCAEAIPLFEEVLLDNPAHGIALDRLAVCLIQAERWPEVVVHLETRLSLGRAEPWTLINLGVALEWVGRSDDALRRYEQALELDPESHAARANRNRLLPGGK